MQWSPSSLIALLLWGCVSGCVSGCASPPFPPEFARTLFASPGDGVCRITIRNGAPHSCSAPIRPQDMPPRVKRTMDELHEGGRTVYLGREWGPDGTAYRVEELVRVGNKEELRSLLVNEEGRVIGRSYEISPANAPVSLLELATDKGFDRSAIRSASIALGTAGDRGRFRLLVEDREGRQHMLQCRHDGSMPVWSRVISARITAARPAGSRATADR